MLAKSQFALICPLLICVDTFALLRTGCPGLFDMPTALVAMEIGFLFNCRVLNRPTMALKLLSNRLLMMGVLIMVVLQIAYTYLPVMNYLFQSSAISWQQRVVIVALEVTAYLIVEMEKWIIYRFSRSPLIHVRGDLVRRDGVVVLERSDQIYLINGIDRAMFVSFVHHHVGVKDPGKSY